MASNRIADKKICKVKKNVYLFREEDKNLKFMLKNWHKVK